jgi:uncharacterized protein
MPLLVNLRHLEKHEIRLQGQMSAAELDMESVDELIRVARPLNYDLEAQKMDNGLLARGRLELTLECECARCLKPFQYRLELPDWAAHLPLEGEEKTPVTNDCVDLTPFIREDILLEFPQHPLCSAECRGLPEKPPGKTNQTGSAGQVKDVSSAWAELNKLKF